MGKTVCTFFKLAIWFPIAHDNLQLHKTGNHPLLPYWQIFHALHLICSRNVPCCPCNYMIILSRHICVSRYLFLQPSVDEYPSGAMCNSQQSDLSKMK